MQDGVFEAFRNTRWSRSLSAQNPTHYEGPAV